MRPLAPLAAALLLASCAALPPEVLHPARMYQPQVDHVSVAGFQRVEYVVTGTQFGQISSPQLGLSGYSVGVTGTLAPASDLTTARYLLENTGCIRLVDEGSTAPIRLEGSANGGRSTGARFIVGIVEALTLLPALGLPVPDRVEASATGRLYLHGRPVKSYESHHELPLWSPIYTLRRDLERATAIARGRALRDVVDQVAADLCGEQRVTE